MELLSKTIVPTKGSGDGLSAKEVNSINNTLNTAVTAINNSYLKRFCDVNFECSSNSKVFESVKDAAACVPESRRSIGMKMKYLAGVDVYSEIVYCGTDTAKENWLNEENWKTIVNVIDGGEW